MKHWSGDYVIVLPGRQWKFHTCVVCGKSLKLGTDSAKTGIGPTCLRSASADAATIREHALESDRRRYKAEVLALGFKIEQAEEPRRFGAATQPSRSASARGW